MPGSTQPATKKKEILTIVQEKCKSCKRFHRKNDFT